ncbi:fibronectin type III domain-containing protein [Polaribacter sp. L3A8]|uniref:fibronectin type III domain-containing protein n=1 Tax=Polaribacter sp. L3A8 TaxID=2686361 RepID=UPI00131C3DAA|nr:fibronectin type III domain-containing protein [Polaribacter sp. L3A8]
MIQFFKNIKKQLLTDSLSMARKWSVKKGFTFYCLLFTFFASAQQYPVQVVHTILPPYPTKLNDYVTSQEVKFRLNLLLTDISISNRQVRLKLHITGNGRNIQSTNTVIGAPLVFLNGGTLNQLSNLDLSAYFQLQNLVGISPQQYNNPLPDGTYSFCWEVYDFLTNQQIANPNTGCTSTFLILNDPPILNLPNNGDQLSDIDPMNIIFQWTPRHINATNVSYEFELRELWDNQMDPQAAFLASPNYYTETTNATTLLYNISKPTLLPGKKYAWRVRAKSTTGLSENSVFRNNGYSEIHYFSYTNVCYPPSFVLAEPLNSGSVKITWQTSTEHKKYHLQYKRSDVPDAEWFEIFSYNNQAQISNLQDGVTYDFRVGGTCNELVDFNQAYSYSTINQFTTPTLDESITYSCGIVPVIEVTNSTPLGNIGVNETFTAGDFPVTIKVIEGGNGNFTGKGFIVVPYLADTKIAVEFSGIKINTDYQLYDGIIKTSYDPTWGNVEDVGDLFNGANGQENFKQIDFPISDIQIDPNGDILVIGTNGQIIEFPGGEDYTITDSNGQVWTVDEEGNVNNLGPQAEGGSSTAENTNGVNSSGEATSISAQGVTVTFTKSSDNVFGFDAYESNQSETQNLYKNLGSGYYVPYKSVAKDADDYIIANLNISDSNIAPKDIIFKTKNGVSIPKVDSTFTNSTTTYKLKLRGVFTDASIETQAVIKQGEKYEIAGAFIQYQAKQKEVDVVLVNTSNTTNINTLKDEVRAVYQQAMVNLNITIVNDFNLDSYASGTTIESGESGFLANYTSQQQTINTALKTRPDYNATAYYLIITDKNPSTPGEKGLMPIGRQFGYIYAATTKTIAHELGHGAFQLKHPFSTHSYGWSENATNWLMDYTNLATHLPYVQWQSMHNPNIHIGIFEGDGEVELAGKIWLTANWTPFSFNSSNKIYDPAGNSQISNGSVPGIVDINNNNRVYVAEEDDYLKAGFSPLLITKFPNLDDNEDVYLFRDAGGCGDDTYYKTTWGYIKNKQNNFLFTDSNIELKGNISCADSSTNTDGGVCNQFTYLKPETNPEHQTIMNSHQTLVNDALDRALSPNGIESTMYTEIRSKGNYKHIQFANSETSQYIDPTQLDMLEDKLHLLSFNKPDTFVTVTFLKIENNLYYLDYLLQDMAQQAITNSSFVGNKKVVNIIIPVSDYQSIFGVGLFNRDSCYNIGYAESEQGIVTSTYSQNSGNSIFEGVIEVFKAIEKPLYVRQYYIKASGEHVQVLVKRINENGKNAINVLNIFESKYVQQIKNLKSNLSTIISSFSMKESPTDDEISSFIDDYNAKKEEIKQKYKFASEHEDITKQSEWTTPTLNDIGTFREVYILDEYAANSYFASKTSYFGFGQNFTILSGFNNLDANLHFYDFDSFSVIDPIVYGLADVLSLIPIPYVDSVGDSLGLVYSTARGDTTQASFFALGLALPVGTAYLKAGSNVFVIAAKKVDNEVVLFKKLKNQVNHADEVVVTSPLTEYSAKADDVYNSLNTTEVKEQIGKHFDEALAANNRLFSFLDNSPGWSSSQIDAFKLEFNQSGDTFKAIFNAAENDARKLNLANSWKRLRENFPNRPFCN